MDRLPEQVVEWHNRHPLAKRISIYDVHTIGVVALPFMRVGSAPGARPAGQIEPVLTDAVSDESLAAWGSEDSTVAANTNAAHLDALADQEELPPAAPAPKRAAGGLLQGLLQRLLPGRGGKAAAGAATGGSWPAFSERFLEKLSARRIAAFAQQHGYSVRPGDASWPQRVVPIDDGLMSRQDMAGGAWPYEIWLMSAAVDAGRSRTRVLAGRTAGAAQPPMLGRRCLDPKRVGLAALIPLCLVTGTGAALWQRGQHAPPETSVAAAAAASAAALPAASASSGVAVAMAEAPAASAAAEAGSAASGAETAALPASPASEPAAESAVAAVRASASAPASEPAAAEIPDIRPRLVERGPLQADRASAPPLRAAAAAPTPTTPTAPAASKPTPVPAPTATTTATAAAAAENTPGPTRKPAAEAASRTAKASTPAEPEAAPTAASVLKPEFRDAAASGGQVVALVGPPTRNKAEAEALLAKMRELVLPMQPDSRDQLQAQLFQSPEGWRAAVWPFSSRIEAQLINATLVARGLHTKAVNF